jgi:hypothetical protein
MGPSTVEQLLVERAAEVGHVTVSRLIARHEALLDGSPVGWVERRRSDLPTGAHRWFFVEQNGVVNGVSGYSTPKVAACALVLQLQATGKLRLSSEGKGREPSMVDVYRLTENQSWLPN